MHTNESSQLRPSCWHSVVMGEEENARTTGVLFLSTWLAAHEDLTEFLCHDFLLIQKNHLIKFGIVL
jgi:hypothetical protein